MNCVNCGAPPRLGLASCPYCESMLNQRVPEADLDGFRLMLRTLEITDTDSYKVDIVERFRKKFTAGQVRKLLATFETDSYRVDAAEHLVPRTTNPSGLLACADLFETDSYRSDFVELLEIGDDVSKVREELEELEDAIDQGCHIMAQVEMADLYGALRHLASAHGLTMADLERMADITERAFREGQR